MYNTYNILYYVVYVHMYILYVYIYLHADILYIHNTPIHAYTSYMKYKAWKMGENTYIGKYDSYTYVHTLYIIHTYYTVCTYMHT
jgi:hypothetical protein